MTMTNFRAEDMPVKVAHAKGSEPPEGQPQTPESAPTQQVPAETPAEATPPPEPQADEDEDEDEPVPDGTTAEILSWVGDDEDRAQRALDKEQDEEKPRVGLTGELEKILADEDDEE